MSLTYLYRGQQSEDQQKWGERITFYKAAHEKLENCVKLAKSLERTDVSNIHYLGHYKYKIS